MATTVDKCEPTPLSSSTNIDKPVIKQRRIALPSSERRTASKKVRSSSASKTSPAKKMPPSQTNHASPGSTAPANSIKLEPNSTTSTPTSMKPDPSSAGSEPVGLPQLANLPPEYVLYYAQLQQQMAALSALSAFATGLSSSSSPGAPGTPAGPLLLPTSAGSGTDSSRDAGTPASEGGDSLDTSTGSALGMGGGVGGKKNYKSLTRERRVEANARERTRVHTISAAFDSLRRSIPSYTSSQKLSKLAILRIACRYIESLATLLDLNHGEEEEGEGRQSLDFSACVHELNETISMESKLRRN